VPTQPLPTPAALELAARIRATTFPRIRYRKGYDRYDVDWLLRKVATELERGTATARLADQLVDAVFSSTTVRSGYDERAVDEFVDGVVADLRRIVGPAESAQGRTGRLASLRRLLRRS